MSLESWIVKARHKVCTTCELLAGCEQTPGRIASLLSPVTQCPLGKHPTREEAIAARAWPKGVAPVSGCCDRIG